MKIPITEFQLPISKNLFGNGLVGYNYILKKEQLKKPLLKTASGRNNADIKPFSVSSVKQKI